MVFNHVLIIIAISITIKVIAGWQDGWVLCMFIIVGKINGGTSAISSSSLLVGFSVQRSVK